MARSWKDTVAELAGPRATLRERPSPPDWGGKVVAEAALSKPLPLLPGSTFQSAGEDSEHAWRRVAHDLAIFRLVEALESAGWRSVEEVVDEARYVAARDPAGAWWAIGVASAEGDLRGYIERDMGYDQRTFERVAFIEPTDARDPASLFAALEVDA